MRCGTPVQAQEDEVAWVCSQCGQGLQLTSDGLAPLNVCWAAIRGDPRSYRWVPFWVLSGLVHFQQRESYGGRRAPDRLWNGPCRFFVPAYPIGLEDMQRLGADLTRRQPQLQPGQPAGALAQCTLFPEDARQAAEFIVLTIEADQRDKLREVGFTLQLGEPELWLLPFTEQGGFRPAI
jgi:hypothetical protein